MCHIKHRSRGSGADFPGPDAVDPNVKQGLRDQSGGS